MASVNYNSFNGRMFLKISDAINSFSFRAERVEDDHYVGFKNVVMRFEHFDGQKSEFFDICPGNAIIVKLWSLIEDSKVDSLVNNIKRADFVEWLSLKASKSIQKLESKRERVFLEIENLLNTYIESGDILDQETLLNHFHAHRHVFKLPYTNEVGLNNLQEVHELGRKIKKLVGSIKLGPDAKHYDTLFLNKLIL